MAFCSPSQIGCAVYYLTGLDNTTTGLLKVVFSEYKYRARINGRSRGFAQVIFSDAEINGNGIRLAKEIKKRFPRSRLVSLKVASSPSTDRSIETWLWNLPSHATLSKNTLYKRSREGRSNPFEV